MPVAMGHNVHKTATHLEPLVEHTPLPLDTHILGPLHKSVNIFLGRGRPPHACNNSNDDRSRPHVIG